MPHPPSPPEQPSAAARLTLTPGAVVDPAAALALATAWLPRFTRRTEQLLRTLHDSHATLAAADDDHAPLIALLRPEAWPTPPAWLALQAFQPGDYALPHRLRDALPAAAHDPGWVAVCPLTGSELAGLTLWDGERFVRVPDEPGRAVVADPDAWGWTSPVGDRARYALVLGGPRA